MTRYFTHYWTNRTWADHSQSMHGELIDHIAGNLFTERGVSSGDTVYIVTVIRGTLYLAGKMEIGKMCNVFDAAEYLGCAPEELWEAKDHAVARAATRVDFNRMVPLEVTERLTFVSAGSSKLLFFKTSGILDQQTLRGMRELTEDAALLLDQLLPPLEAVDPAPIQRPDDRVLADLARLLLTALRQDNLLDDDRYPRTVGTAMKLEQALFRFES